MSKVKVSNSLSNFKDIINNVASQLDTVQAKRKHDEVEVMLVEYSPHFREKKRNYKCKTISNL